MAPQIIKSTYKDYPLENRGNIFDFIQSNPNKIPDSKVAFVRLDGKELTRKDLFSTSRRLAHGLRHKLQLKPGSRIAIFSPNSTYYPIAVYAGLCAGIVVVPVNPGYGPDELVHPLLDAEIQYILAHPAVAPVARKAIALAKLSEKGPSGHPRVLLLDDSDNFAKGENGEPDVRTLMGDEELATFKVEDPVNTDAFIAYSSGTSGAPKGVQLSHNNMTSVTTAMIDGLGGDMTKDDLHVACLPMQHIFALAKYIHHAPFMGITTIVLPKFDLEGWCKAVQEHKVTIGIVVPPILVLLAKHPVIDKYDLSSLKFLMCGAAPLSAELGDAVEKRLKGTKVTQGYGLSETSPTATYTPHTDYVNFKGCAGALLPRVEARLVDDDGNDVGHQQGDEGKPGELWLRGPTIMRGYLNRPEVNKEAITEDGWFKTGDVGIFKKDHLYITDRKKELIKYKGFQVPPAELEALLLQHPKIADVAVLGIYSESEATEFPRAYVVPQSDVPVGSDEEKKAFADEVVKWTASKVANHKKLRGGVVVTDAIPKSPSGKILRRILRDQQAQEQKDGKVKL